MAETAHHEITIDAPVEVVYRVLVDFELYPEWIPLLKEVTVLERDEEGRATDVQFRAAAMGRSTTYRLGYDYSGAPDRLVWFLLEGDIERELGGSYELRGTGDTTSVHYDLEIDIIIPMPGFVKRRAESHIVKAALEDLKRQAESSV